MHHIALCTPYIVHFNIAHLLHIRVDHAEPKTEIKAEQVQWVFRGPQALSCEDANIVIIKASPGASHQIFIDFSFNLYDCVMLVGALAL
jgi:hypothetical protein